MIIALGLCLDHSRQINHLPSGGGFGEGQVREASQSLTKESRQLRDISDVLIREAEAALHALRETMGSRRRTQGNA